MAPTIWRRGTSHRPAVLGHSLALVPKLRLPRHPHQWPKRHGRPRQRLKRRRAQTRQSAGRVWRAGAQHGGRPREAGAGTEGVYSRDMGRGNSREGGGRGVSGGAGRGPTGFFLKSCSLLAPLTTDATAPRSKSAAAGSLRKQQGHAIGRAPLAHKASCFARRAPHSPLPRARLTALDWVQDASPLGLAQGGLGRKAHAPHVARARRENGRVRNVSTLAE
jgi:hypothetical protein